MMNFKVYIGDEIYLAYIWTNDQTKYTPVVLKSAKIPTLENKQIGLANILREKESRRHFEYCYTSSGYSNRSCLRGKRNLD